MMHCEPCGKSFTGELNYQQHLKSDKHIRKLKNLEMLTNGSSKEFGTENISNIDKSVRQSFNCPTCNMSFDSFTDFQFHAVSSVHITNVQSIKNKEDFSSCEVSSSSPEDTTDHINESIQLASIDKDDMIISENTQSFKVSYTDCKICSKHFSGPESYRQHIESIGHKKKIEMENALQRNISSTFECSICRKTFSGHIPYNQHMGSEIHKKKMETAKILEQMKGNTQLDSVSECNSADDTQNSSKLDILKATSVDNPWYCKCCNTQCSGYVPYTQHLTGTVHQKNLRKAQIENTLSKSDAMKQHYVLNPQLLQQSTTSEASNQTDKVNINDKLGLNQKVECDYILPHGIENLKVMSVDELKLTEILPGMKIEFDKVENETDANLKTNINEPKISNEIERNKENVYQKCKFCNVNLIDKEQAIEHYESFEHIKKSMEYYKMKHKNILMEF